MPVFLIELNMDKGKTTNQWLTIADFHYLSAGLLFMHGLYPVALHVAATATEMYLKCLLLIKGEDSKKIRKMKHDLFKLFQKANIKLAPKSQELVDELKKSYTVHKYPDSWTANVEWKERLRDLDTLVYQLRNRLIEQLQPEDKKMVQDIIKISRNPGFLMPNTASRYGVLSLKDVFLRSNEVFAKFKSI